jgi:hypothetical protein
MNQMIKKVTRYIIIAVVFLLIPHLLLADGDPPESSSKSGNFSKKTFSNDNTWSKGGKAAGAPTIGSDDFGATAPISGGLLFLVFGSTLFILKRIKEEQK